MPLRDDFPPAGSDYLGGTSDGWEYRTVFSGTTLEASYAMVVQFLKEEGYGNVPIPANALDLALFRHPRRHAQFILVAEPGYVHNPVRILFHSHSNRQKDLILCVYNENAPHHLLRFHGVGG
jgi:hypothetical protein